MNRLDVHYIKTGELRAASQKGAGRGPLTFLGLCTMLEDQARRAKSLHNAQKLASFRSAWSARWGTAVLRKYLQEPGSWTVAVEVNDGRAREPTMITIKYQPRHWLSPLKYIESLPEPFVIEPMGEELGGSCFAATMLMLSMLVIRRTNGDLGNGSTTDDGVAYEWLDDVEEKSVIPKPPHGRRDEWVYETVTMRHKKSGARATVPWPVQDDDEGDVIPQPATPAAAAAAAAAAPAATPAAPATTPAAPATTPATQKMTGGRPAAAKRC